MKNEKINAIPIILAGGSGTRLWPLSRAKYPKQFLSLDSHNSLIQQTAIRIRETFSQSPVVVGNEAHRFLIAEQFRSLDITPNSILLEPLARNTAPAIAAAAWHSLETEDNPLLAVFPSDHLISDVEGFRQSMIPAQAAARKGSIVTFGVRPDRPETGYGYIEVGESSGIDDSFLVSRFLEKPDIATAESFLSNEGQFLWNSGIFMFSADSFLSELEQFEPEMYELSRMAYKNRSEDLDFLRLDEDNYSGIRAKSIDYAIMEPTSKAAVVELKCDWSDAGSWEGIYNALPHDSNDNVLTGDIIVQDTANCYINANSRLVSAIGLRNLSIVETDDSVLISEMSRTQDTKLVVEQLLESKRKESDVHATVYRPWGSYESLNMADRFQVKRITVKPGAKLSLQKHFHRSEHWIVVRGTAIVTNGDAEILLTENQSTYIPLGNMHRLENPGSIPLELIEVQSGSYLGEDDIVRFEDDYGRKETGDC